MTELKLANCKLCGEKVFSGLDYRYDGATSVKIIITCHNKCSPDEESYIFEENFEEIINKILNVSERWNKLNEAPSFKLISVEVRDIDYSKDPDRPIDLIINGEKFSEDKLKETQDFKAECSVRFLKCKCGGIANYDYEKTRKNAESNRKWWKFWEVKYPLIHVCLKCGNCINEEYLVYPRPVAKIKDENYPKELNTEFLDLRL